MKAANSSLARCRWNELISYEEVAAKGYFRVFVQMESFQVNGKGESVVAASPDVNLQLLRTVFQSLALKCQALSKLSELQKLSAELSQEPLVYKNIWAAMECAILDFWSQEKKQSLEQFLELEPLKDLNKFYAALGSPDAKNLWNDLQCTIKAGVSDVQLKISGDYLVDLSKLQLIKKNLSSSALLPSCIRLDARDAWKANRFDQAETFLENLPLAVCSIEEPFPVEHLDLWWALGRSTKIPLVIRASPEIFEKISQEEPGNVKWIFAFDVSALGGVFSSLALLKKVLNKGYGVQIKASLLESSVLTRLNLLLAAQCGTQLCGLESFPGISENGPASENSKVLERIKPSRLGYLWTPAHLREGGLGLQLKPSSQALSLA